MVALSVSGHIMRLGRNAPCSCGSGKKFKRCCGKSISIDPTSRPPASTYKRQCGDCTACCDGWLVSEIYGHEMKPGVPCFFKKDGCCSIYERRPVLPCREFLCSWIAPNCPFPESFKPDQVGVIILPIKWQGQPAYRLCSAGRDPDSALLQWMFNFSQQTGYPFFYEEAGETVGYGSATFQEELLLHMQRGLPLW